MTDTASTGNVGVALFTPIAPPKLDTIAHAGLVEWKKKRTEYEAQVIARCAATKEKVEDVMVSVKNTMDRQLLKTCCELEWDLDHKEITDVQLVERLDEIIKSVKNDTLPDVDQLFGTGLKMDLKETDVKARIVK
jgi:hypothetical protein